MADFKRDKCNTIKEVSNAIGNIQVQMLHMRLICENTVSHSEYK